MDHRKRIGKSKVFFVTKWIRNFLSSGVTAAMIVASTGCNTDSNVHGSAPCPPLTQNSSFHNSKSSPDFGRIFHLGNTPFRESPPTARPATIFLPSTLFLLVGQRYRLYFANFIGGFNSNLDKVSVEVSGSRSEATADYWEYVPDAPGSYTLSISVKDGSGNTRASTTRPVVVSALTTGSNLRHLSIGDSITRAGNYTELAVQCVFGGKTVGTRTYDGGTVATEGRGGWTAERFLTRIAESAGGDSPFLFPIGVRGEQYRGNTAFWQAVTTSDPEGYDYRGFQMIARDWRSSGPFPFDANGYPTNAKLGDVVVDPTLPDGERWRQYDGSTWLPMNPQPATSISLAKYMERYAPAFSSGPPTSVSIMLGTVDFLSFPPDEYWPTFKSQLDWLIAAIRQWDPDIPIILIGAPSGGPKEMWTDQRISGAEFNRRIVDLSRRLYATYDSPEARDKGLYVISFLGVVSSSNMADYVHPKVPEGHAEMAPWLAGILSHLLTTGRI